MKCIFLRMRFPEEFSAEVEDGAVRTVYDTSVSAPQSSP